MDFLRNHQLNIMLILIGVTSVLSFLVAVTKTLTTKRRNALLSLELSAMLLLVFDRFAYIFRGNESTLGWWMVRISNFLVYLFSLTVVHAFNNYLIDLFLTEGNLKKIPVRLRISKIISVTGIALIIISQFTHLYYSFDSHNQYVRSPLFFIAFLIPFSMVILQLTVIIQYYSKLRRLIRIPLLLFAVIPFIATILQIFSYGLSLTNISIVGEAIILYIFVLLDLNKSVDRANKREIEIIRNEQRNMQIMFEQTATALANAIDAKDEYTHGHSMRVAEYSKQIAQLSGKPNDYCMDVYFAGLLHDVGKIGIPNNIINKKGRLTQEEFAEIKKHPEIGKQILSGISKSPYLAIGANYHHERYDGHGYPYGLKGDDIPEIARIIAVADAYDAMTSKRSYRDPIPQDKVREEIVKGIDAQFDPEFAKIMLHMIDLDTEYQLKEHEEIREFSGKKELLCKEYKTSYTDGILINSNISTINLNFTSEQKFDPETSIPSLIIFDSLDGRMQIDERKQKDILYFEYAEIRIDGKITDKNTRKIQTEIIKKPETDELFEYDCEIQAVKYKDHILIQINNQTQIIKITIALLDSSHFAYIALTGEHCIINKVDIKKAETKIDQNYIPRIADEISFINVPAGDIPNIQIDGWCTDASTGIPVKDEMKFIFHSISLPSARLIWHCPYVMLFYSENQKIDGKNFKNLGLIRLDGENWESDKYTNIKITINKTQAFEGWDAWKEMNKKGFDSTVTFKRNGNQVIVITENGGISIRCVVTVEEAVPEIYAALTGDECAITNIRIKQ